MALNYTVTSSVDNVMCYSPSSSSVCHRPKIFSLGTAPVHTCIWHLTGQIRSIWVFCSAKTRGWASPWPCFCASAMYLSSLWTSHFTLHPPHLKSHKNISFPCQQCLIPPTSPSLPGYLQERSGVTLHLRSRTWLEISSKCLLMIPAQSVDSDSQPTVVSAESSHGCHKKFGATCYEGADWESH